MNTSSTSSTKPYLMRAIFEWANDNSFTPQVLVNTNVVGVEVPQDHVVDGQIVLNIGLSAIKLHVMDNECLSFSARFNGIEQDIFLPIDSILAIFARENSQGIFFEEIENGIDPEPTLNDVSSSGKDKSNSSSENKKANKPHLKIIK